MNTVANRTIEAGGETIAVETVPGRNPGLFWLGGFRSDMAGTKAEAIRAWAVERGYACTRHDYSGHGESSGDYRDGTVSRWLDESLAVLGRCTSGPQVLVGSSMGGWIALRMIQELEKSGESHRIAGLVLLAPAPDFTFELIEPGLSDAERRDLEIRGYFEEPSQYSGEPNRYTRSLIEDGRNNRVLEGRIDTHCPVHILQGQADPDVPVALALKLVEHLPADDVTLTLIKDGDHRLSRPQDIALLLRVIEAMIRTVQTRS